MTPEPVVRVSDLTIGWPDAVLLEGASFEIRRGEVFAILGRSGSGKSTLLRHLVGLAAPMHGTIDVLGRAPSVSATSGPPPFGVTFQSGALLGSLTVGENIALPVRHWARIRGEVLDALVRAKLRIVGLHGAAEMMPSELSGGMRTRAAIARAMVLEPSLLFLAEPMAGLDPVTAADLDALLAVLNRALGLTVVLVTHDLASVERVVGRCLLVDRTTRSIVATGDPRELRETSGDPRVRDFFNPSARQADTAESIA